MLREVPRVFSHMTEQAVQVGSLGLLIATAMMVGGLRPLSAQPPTDTATANNAASSTIEVKAGDQLIDLLPQRYGAVFQEINVSQLMKSPTITEALSKSQPNTGGMSLGEILQRRVTVIPPSQVESVLIAWGGKSITLIQSKEPISLDDGEPMVIVPHESGSEELMLITPKILARASGDVLQELTRFLQQPSAQRDSVAKHVAATEAFLRVSCDWPAMKPMVLSAPGFANSPNQMMIRPLTDNAQRWTIEASSPSSTDPVSVQIVGEFPTEKEALAAKDTLTALRILMQNMMSGIQYGSNEPAVKGIRELGVALLDKAEANVSGTKVVATSTVDRSMDEMITVFGPALVSSQMANLRMQDTNNLRQIMLAMHNYHDTFKHFPKAVVIDPESGVPHSWRIELLPYMGHQELYDQYRMDQPWDSTANKRLLNQIPTVYQTGGGLTPGIASQGMTNFLAIVGKDTALAPAEGDNPGLKHITDGSSNTVVFVHTNKDVPWTKPEDLTLKEADSAKLGGFHPGGFLMVLADGAVKFVSNAIDPATWKLLMTRSDNQVVPNY